MKWLNNAGVEHCFYDLRKDGLKYWTIANWIKRPVWRKFLNRQDCTRSRLPRKKNRNSLAAALQISSGNSHFIMKRSVQDYKETLEVFLARKGAPHFCMNTTTSYQ